MSKPQHRQISSRLPAKAKVYCFVAITLFIFLHLLSDSSLLSTPNPNSMTDFKTLPRPPPPAPNIWNDHVNDPVNDPINDPVNGPVNDPVNDAVNDAVDDHSNPPPQAQHILVVEPSQINFSQYGGPLKEQIQKGLDCQRIRITPNGQIEFGKNWHAIHPNIFDNLKFALTRSVNRFGPFQGSLTALFDTAGNPICQGFDHETIDVHRRISETMIGCSECVLCDDTIVLPIHDNQQNLETILGRMHTFAFENFREESVDAYIFHTINNHIPG